MIPKPCSLSYFDYCLNWVLPISSLSSYIVISDKICFAMHVACSFIRAYYKLYVCRPILVIDRLLGLKVRDFHTGVKSHYTVTMFQRRSGPNKVKIIAFAQGYGSASQFEHALV